MARQARAATPTRRELAEAIAYASLIADICKLSAYRDHAELRSLEQEVFIKLGWETTFNKRGYMIREPGESYWQSMPQILTDFGTAIRYTIGYRHGSLDRPLECNWYIQEMCQTSEITDPTGGRIAAWAVRLAKRNKIGRDATAITPAAALVAAWLRTH
jgi:hypothetical protein